MSLKINCIDGLGLGIISNKSNNIPRIFPTPNKINYFDRCLKENCNGAANKHSITTSRGHTRHDVSNSPRASGNKGEKQINKLLSRAIKNAAI